jgi:hypothetical protein
VLARLSADLDLSDEMLRETRAWLAEQDKPAGRKRATAR